MYCQRCSSQEKERKAESFFHWSPSRKPWPQLCLVSPWRLSAGLRILAGGTPNPDTPPLLLGSQLYRNWGVDRKFLPPKSIGYLNIKKKYRCLVLWRQNLSNQSLRYAHRSVLFVFFLFWMTTQNHRYYPMTSEICVPTLKKNRSSDQ